MNSRRHTPQRRRSAFTRRASFHHRVEVSKSRHESTTESMGIRQHYYREWARTVREATVQDVRPLYRWAMAHGGEFEAESPLGCMRCGVRRMRLEHPPSRAPKPLDTPSYGAVNPC